MKLIPSLPGAYLDELRARTTLSSLIGQKVKLQRAGREWKACCPFHAEKSPSFTINDEKGFYHCFGCGAHGDAISWLKESEGLSLHDAARILASGAGILFPPPNSKSTAPLASQGANPSDPPAAKRGGAKLSRTETVTVRLDPKLNYLCELAARAQRRTKSSFIEWAIADSLGSVSLPEVTTYEGGGAGREVTLREKTSELWHVDEADRTAALALVAPALLTHEEQLIWRLVRENGYLWRGCFNKQGEWIWEVDEDHLIVDRLRDNWDAFKAVASGELPKELLPKWQKVRAPGFDPDDGVPF